MRFLPPGSILFKIFPTNNKFKVGLHTTNWKHIVVKSFFFFFSLFWGEGGGVILQRRSNDSVHSVHFPLRSILKHPECCHAARTLCFFALFKKKQSKKKKIGKEKKKEHLHQASRFTSATLFRQKSQYKIHEPTVFV